MNATMAAHTFPGMPVSARLDVLPQYFFPKKAITAFAGFVAGNRWGFVTTRIIRWFVRKYGVDMNEAINPDIASYATFNDFFTRGLKPGMRPLADADLICPVDGAISQFGAIDRQHIFQAKGHHYTIAAVVGGDAQLAAQFEHGSFATLYLSPKDYHRIHMPCDGRLTRMIYVPGDLFSVNPVTARGVPGLFARNERVVCVFETIDKNANEPGSSFVLILVGATIVGSMQTVWHGVVNPPRTGDVREWHYGDQPGSKQIVLKKGEEMGRFLLGSTVVMLFPQQLAGRALRFNPAWMPAGAIRLGEEMARYELSAA
ncbi:MAG: psd [Rhodocyclales bacterium]|nr:psd [Rhodocyclales bacterium]